MLTLVTGLGRSGTSLAMRMLDAGGLPPTDGTDRTLGYEDNSYQGVLDPVRLFAAEGRALKLMRLNAFMLPRGLDVRVIFCVRTYVEQAKSHAKLWGESDPNITKVAEQCHSDTQAMLAQLSTTNTPTLALRFRDVLARPLAQARRIAGFLDLDLDTEAMARVVVARDPACFNGFMAEDAIGRQTHLDLREVAA